MRATGLALVGGLVCGLLPLVGHGQTANLDLYTEILTLTFDCKQMPGLGCISFQQMVKSRDSEIESLALAVATGKEVYICAGTADRFLTIQYDVPSPLAFSKQETSPVLHAKSVASFAEYRDGVQGTAYFFILDWQKLEDSPLLPPFAPIAVSEKDSPRGWVTIDPSEIVLGNSYQNIAGTTTRYTLQVRTSTRRYVETYDVETEHQRITDTGRCVKIQSPRLQPPRPPEQP